MSAFSSQLQALFQQTGLSVYAMSKACGVERTFLHKILNGTRMPASESVVEKIADAMRLGPAETESLFRQYVISRDGEEACERRQAVHNLLTGLSLPERRDRFVVRRRVDVEAIPHVAADRVTVMRLIKLLLDVEVSEPGGSVQLCCGAEDEFLWRLLSVYLYHRPDLPVRQTVCLRRGGAHAVLLHNLELLRHTLPLALSSASYRALVRYGERSCAPLLPNLLLTSRYALQFSDDFSFAMLSDDAERLGLFDTLLAHQTRGCHPLIRPLQDPMALLEYYGQMNEQCDGGGQLRLYALGPEPCVTPFYTKEILDEFLSPELQNPETKALILGYSAQSRRLLERCQVTRYFTAGGVERFLRTGRLTELPDAFYRPFSPEVRRELIRAQTAQAEAVPGYLPLAMDTEKLHIPDNIILETAANGALSLIYAHPDAGFLAFALDEPQLCFALFDYLESLRQSRYVMSREDSAALLRAAAQGP